MKHLIFLLVGIITCFSGVSAHLSSQSSSELSSENAASTSGLGHIDFPTSAASEQAQQWFLRGVLLLHSFEYDDAKAAFFQAQVIDPNFAMAYWGEAMTENHPLWLEQNATEAQKILNRLAPTVEARFAKAPTQREKGYLHAVELLYGEGDKLARDLAYAEAMRQLSAKFPDDLEAAAFHALALLGSEQGQRNFRTYMKAAAIGEGIFHKNPRHPGAVHYLIHSYDDPIHAPLGLRAARVYGALAPAASHAQHMPSHIFMSLGMWDDAAEANEASWASSEARIKQKGLKHEARPYHTLHWLEYAYLQQGRAKDAKALLEIIDEDAQATSSSYVRGYVAVMRATFTIEARQWDVNRIGEDRSGLRFSSASGELFAIGMSGVNTEQINVSQQALAKLKKLITSTETSSLSNEALSGKVMAKELEGLLLLQAGDNQKALQVLQEATEMEDRLPYAYGPPFPIKPAHELFGEVLLELEQKKKAKKEFELTLDRAPQRALALEGLARATQ
jgi:tetratricopeptide (TPR) repeat protein